MNFDDIDKARVAAQKTKVEEVGEEEEKFGHVMEREVLGEINVEGYKRFMKRKMEELGEKKPSEETMFKIYRDAVKENQKTFKNPSDPRERRFPSDLHTQIAEALGIEYEQLRYYTAVGTEGSDIDTKYGTDAFLELDLGNGKTIDLKLDFTLKPEEKTAEKCKADIIIGEWKGIPWQAIKYEVSDFDKDDEETLKEKKKNRDLYDQRTKDFAKLGVEILIAKAKKEGVEKIEKLTGDQIKKSQEQGYGQYEKEVGRAVGSKGLRRDLEMRRLKKNR